MKVKEEILKALKEEITHRVRCHDCLVSNFYLTSVGKKIYPNFDGRVTCFYRLCAILEYYFNIAIEETQKNYLKYGRYTDFFILVKYSKQEKIFGKKCISFV